jgi:DNA segregation ATPase FtsK/SpoIIIE, S-DNA-T family
MTARPTTSRSAGTIARHLAREVAWRTLLYRWELAPIAVFAAAWSGVRLALGTGQLVSVVALVAGAVAGVAVARRWWTGDRRRAHGVYRRMKRLRRSWPDVATDLGLVGTHKSKPATPKIAEAMPLPGGVALSLVLPPGVTATQVERRAEAIAGALRASQTIVERDPRRADQVRLTVIDEDDPLLDASPPPDALLSLVAGRDEAWGCPVGTFYDGTTASLRLLERSLLIAGAPGSGKSAALHQICAATALTEHAELWLIDPKRVELAAWEPCAARTCHEDITEATALLVELIGVMDRRYRLLQQRRMRKVASPTAELPLIVLVIEELAAFTFGADKKASAEFIRALGALVQRGRAAAISIVAVTQKPQADVVPSFIRDQLAYRMAFRSGTAAHSDVILGDGMAAAGADASRIPENAPGLGLLIGEGERTARRFRTVHLSDAQLRALADRATDYRTREGRGAR